MREANDEMIAGFRDIQIIALIVGHGWLPVLLVGRLTIAAESTSPRRLSDHLKNMLARFPRAVARRTRAAILLRSRAFAFGAWS